MALVIYGGNKGIKEALCHSIEQEVKLSDLILNSLDFSLCDYGEKYDKLYFHFEHMSQVRRSINYFMPFIAEHLGCCYLQQGKAFCMIAGPIEIVTKVSLLAKQLDSAYQNLTTQAWADLCLAHQRWFIDNYEIFVSQYELIKFEIVPKRSVAIEQFAKYSALELGAKLDKTEEQMALFMKSIAYVKEIFAFDYAPFRWSRIEAKSPVYPIYQLEKLNSLGSILKEQARANQRRNESDKKKKL